VEGITKHICLKVLTINININVHIEMNKNVNRNKDKEAAITPDSQITVHSYRIGGE
jgi:hypothetical protein